MVLTFAGDTYQTTEFRETDPIQSPTFKTLNLPQEIALVLAMGLNTPISYDFALTATQVLGTRA